MVSLHIQDTQPHHKQFYISLDWASIQLSSSNQRQLFNDLCDLSRSLRTQITSFKQTDTNSAVDSDYNPTKTCCIKHWNTAGAFVTLDGITLNSNNPLWVIKAVFCWLSAWTLVYQYPDLRSSVVKYLDFPIWSSKSNTLGSGNTLSLVTELRAL